MKFFKETPTRPTAEIPNASLPITPKGTIESGNQLVTLGVVAQTLGVSKRYVQKLVQRKAIPVIRLGKRCPRFDLNRVLAAVKRFEVEEMTLR